MRQAWWRRVPAVDGAIAAVVAVQATFGTWAELRGAGRPVPGAVPAYTLALAACAVLVWRRRHPVPVTLAALALTAAYHGTGYPGEALGLALFVGLYSVAAYGGPRSLAVALGLTVVAAALPTLPPHGTPWNNPGVYGPAVGIACVTILGGTVRQRRVDAEERVRRAQSAAEAELRRRLTEERLRMARDLHDVLAHTISVIAVQSGLALDAMDDNPELVRQAVLTMRGSAREALAELRAALAMLRGEDGTPAPSMPQPRLSEVPALAAAAQSAGLAVHIDAEGTGAELPPLVELTAYRIVQEALTNAVRHSGAGSVWVRLRRDPDALRVEVSDDGHGLPARPTPGMGLRGMRERAESLGGQLTLGAREGGGCRILAELPL
ncbi:MAG TPA: histidine kinase [Rugosimonospora sp.]|nr:histidine kinase [Rugosimonospora sp.]